MMASSATKPTVPSESTGPLPAPKAEEKKPATLATSVKGTPTQESSTLQVKSLLLELPELKMQFGLMRKKCNRTTLIVDPLRLSRVIDRTYQTLVFSLGGILAAPITQANFLRVCRTIVHKRLQDIVTFQSKIRPQNEIKIQRSFLVPQPIGELLYALGPYDCAATGMRYELSPMNRPAAEAEVPPYMIIDANIWRSYLDFIAMTEERFMYVRFPKEADMAGQPLMLTTKEVEGNLERVQGALTEVQPSNAYLRFVHEEFFTDPPFTTQTCEFYLTEQLYVDSVVEPYVNSYLKKVGV